MESHYHSCDRDVFFFLIRDLVVTGVSFDSADATLGLLASVTLTLRRLTSYIYGAPILDVSRSHTTTQHSR